MVRHSKLFDFDRNGPSEGESSLCRWLIDPHRTRVTESTLDDSPQEFPRLDERLTGQAYRYGYRVAGSLSTGGGLYRHDLLNGGREQYQQGPDRRFMEPVFVPRSADSGEDDGWVLAFVYDRSTDGSDVVVLDAADFGGEPVATVHLPRRVPFGFHGNWIPD